MKQPALLLFLKLEEKKLFSGSSFSTPFYTKRSWPIGCHLLFLNLYFILRKEIGDKHQLSGTFSPMTSDVSVQKHGKHQSQVQSNHPMTSCRPYSGRSVRSIIRIKINLIINTRFFRQIYKMISKGHMIRTTGVFSTNRNTIFVRCLPFPIAPISTARYSRTLLGLAHFLRVLLLPNY